MALIQKDKISDRQIKFLVGIRLLLVFVLLGLGSVLLKVERFPFYGLMGSFYFLSIIYLLLIKTKISKMHLIGAQLVFDLILIFGVFHFSGGIHSVFISIVLLPLIAAGLFLPWSGCLFITLFATVGYLVLTSLEYFGLLPVSDLFPQFHLELKEIAFLTSLRILMIWSVSFLSAFLANKLRIQTSSYIRLKRLHDLILEQIGSGIITVNSQNEIVYMNKGAEEIIGAKTKEYLGRNWKTLFFFSSSPEVNELWEKSAQGVRGYEVMLKRKDGSKVPIGFNVTRLTDQNQQFFGKVMIFRDLTRIKELERQQRQNERLAAIGEMAAGIAHEIRNPLASISGSVEILSSKKAFDKKFTPLIEVILREAQRLNGFIDSFLNFSKRPDLSKRLVDLEKVLDEVMELLRFNGKWKDLYQIQKINEIKGKTQFLFDPNQIKQVFYNLISNACEVMLEGGKIEVRLSESNETPRMIRIDIVDQGLGIPEEKLPKIFTPFYTTKKRGTGLGLAIVHRIIQEHGGSISVKSEVNKGTVFSVYLPRGDEALKAA